MAYVISTLSTDTEYTIYSKKRKDINVVEKKILIKGGSNVINKNTLQVSSKGVTTVVKDQDLQDLEQNPVFKLHQSKGFVRIIKSGGTVAAEKEAESMSEKDNSAQLTEKDFTKKGMKPPKTTIEEVSVGEDRGKK